MRLRACALASLFASLVVAACSSDGSRSGACAPGDYVRVGELADGGTSYLKCASDGSGYAPFEGDPFAPPDAGIPTSCDRADNGGALGFMCGGCTTAADCVPGFGLVCFDFPNKGGFLCTRPCSGPSDCPLPSAGCGNNGHCKPQ